MAVTTKNRKIHKNYLELSPETAGPTGLNNAEMVFRWSHFGNASDNHACQLRWPPLLKIENSAKYHVKIVSDYLNPNAR